jgi:hypothetical protein
MVENEFKIFLFICSRNTDVSPPTYPAVGFESSPEKEQQQQAPSSLLVVQNANKSANNHRLLSRALRSINNLTTAVAEKSGGKNHQAAESLPKMQFLFPPPPPIFRGKSADRNLTKKGEDAKEGCRHQQYMNNNSNKFMNTSQSLRFCYL